MSVTSGVILEGTIGTGGEDQVGVSDQVAFLMAIDLLGKPMRARGSVGQGQMASRRTVSLQMARMCIGIAVVMEDIPINREVAHVVVRGNEPEMVVFNNLLSFIM